LPGNFNMRVFPNPAVSFVNIEFAAKLSGKYLVEIVDFNGNVRERKEVMFAVGKNDFTVDVNKLPKGNYVVRVGNGISTATQKLIITK